jgi:hypothetical protein
MKLSAISPQLSAIPPRRVSFRLGAVTKQLLLLDHTWGQPLTRSRGKLESALPSPPWGRGAGSEGLFGQAWNSYSMPTPYHTGMFLLIADG